MPAVLYCDRTRTRLVAHGWHTHQCTGWSDTSHCLLTKLRYVELLHVYNSKVFKELMPITSHCVLAAIQLDTLNSKKQQGVPAHCINTPTEAQLSEATASSKGE
eukprot:GHUV01028193.1.p1 GENE.GHUV01028193.1~~GHUV01028193.1.p1  ORF type:complete len:104 (+),score=23.40 GHUV01028193.1:490-801(+)